MFFRICVTAIVASFVISGSAQAQTEPVQARQIQFRSLTKMSDPRAEFVRQCAPHMVGRWAHPESICGCLHDYAAAAVEDPALREALLRGISETGGNARRRQFVAADHFLVPSRGTHLTARTMPPAVILAPETSLIWPAGHDPSSTWMR